MSEIGIGYLSLAQRMNTLFGGEIQQIKIVRNLGSSLPNITYIFDELTSGLHPADAEKIVKILIDLSNKNNNVLVVEHKLYSWAHQSNYFNVLNLKPHIFLNI